MNKLLLPVRSCDLDLILKKTAQNSSTNDCGNLVSLLFFSETVRP